MRSIFLGWVPEPPGYGSSILYCSHPKSPLKTADFSVFYPCIIADGKKKGKFVYAKQNTSRNIIAFYFYGTKLNSITLKTSLEQAVFSVVPAGSHIGRRFAGAR